MTTNSHSEPNRPIAELRRNGIVYTPPVLGDFVAQKVVGYFLEDVLSAEKPSGYSFDSSQWRILDPACGRGELLEATWRQLQSQLQAPEAGPHLARSLDPSTLLCGIDNDGVAMAGAKKRIADLTTSPVNRNGHSSIVKTNALFPYNRKRSRWGWDEMLQRLDAECGVDIVIANPPWGAELTDCIDKVSREEFELAVGQFDSAELFLELSLSITRKNGYIAFIMPDSIFAKERSAVRRLLLSHVELKFVGRFGEKIFPNVNRGCAVVIGKVGGDVSGKPVCLRLTPSVRRQILGGGMTFSEAEMDLAHQVAQRRFGESPDALFDIDATTEDEGLLHQLEASGTKLRSFLQSSRGVELSKRGKVYRCEHCDLWMPFPSSNEPTCPHCGVLQSLSSKRTDHLVASREKPGYAPLIVGEDVQRYAITPGRWIDTTRPGINYKDRDNYAAPKLLVRKTGVGISAAIDYSIALTNQVVYILKLVPSVEPAPPIELFQAILCSRAIYYYLVKRFGETEWRSHPYITQSQLLDLPAPPIVDLTDSNSRPIQRIVSLVRRYAARCIAPPFDVDAQIERDVAELYGLNADDYQTIYKTIEAAENLLPVRALKNITAHDIFAE